MTSFNWLLLVSKKKKNHFNDGFKLKSITTYYDLL